MKISDHDLRQINAESLHALGQRDLNALEDLAIRLADDLKEVKERLNQTPDNSSRPPSSRDPWARNKEEEKVPQAPCDDVPEDDADDTDGSGPGKTRNTPKRKKGWFFRRTRTWWYSGRA